MIKNLDLSVELFGCMLKNPIILASGILGTTRNLLRMVSQNGAGAVTIKSISVDPRKGHPNPTVLAFGHGLINAVGYSNPGLEKAVQEFSDLHEIGCPVIGSIIGTCVEDFSRVAIEFDKLEFSALEVPLSCPHTPEYGKMGNQDNPDAVFRIVSAICSNTSKPLLVKVPPAANDLVEMALAAKAAGAYGITAVNTVGPGMLIDIDSGKPYLGFGMGGISGPAIKPLAVAAVFQLYKAVDMPIIGTGGVSTGRDVIEMIMAGASAVGIGTAVLSRGLSVFQEITEEIKQLLLERGVSSIADIRGLAHEV
ncbi:dihydroorotate dehydrogenase [Patescibacteria group bacterium]|nr:dihydroorotate dehydrogenase [Patescibacteria group bacterium]MBU1663441.1 dihydroorotate dehydrogenase [Patescibacteria group bacterium]MBU1933635.1 dihydroorotate dehydrogenase [Patescibacteria group bacterium]MBU2007783.1 dihydroorotate dehydrogenase [Patescibacteria group bacterium]MBU2233782.1 dihydroorotate dehydrogenase [Patescibacteria group bacterium]